MPRRTLIVALILLALASALRFHEIDAQSLWYDEGNSARIAERSVQLIIEGAAGDIHPPLYYLALRGWREMAGGSEFSLRALSALSGVLLAALAGRLAGRLFGGRAGLFALFAVAVSPFAVYYSQEVRMYAPLAMLATLSSALVVELGPGHRRRAAAAGLGLATAAGLYTQYAYPFVMLAQGAAALIILSGLRGRDARAFLIAYAVANAAAIASFAPWLPIAVRQITGWSVAQQDYALGPAVVDALRWIVVGRTLPLDPAAPALAAFAALAVAGLAAQPAGRRGRRSAWTAAALFAVPLALLFAFTLYRESYLKFLLVCVPPLAALIANGAEGAAALAGAAVRRGSARPAARAAAAGLCAVGVAWAVWPSLANLYGNPAFARDDYRGIARRIAAVERDGDAILFNAPNQWEVFTYYHPDDSNLFPMQYRPVYEDVVAQNLERVAFSHRRLFVLFYAERESDPNGWHEAWLARNTFKVREEWVGNIRLATYAVGLDPALAQTFGGVAFGEPGARVELRAAAIDAGRAADWRLIPAQLTWRAESRPDRRLKVFIHVGPEDGPPAAQFDGEPASGFRPTTSWAPGQDVVDRRGVWLAPGTPPGRHGVFVGLYDADTGQRLRLTVDGRPMPGDRYRIGDVTVSP